MVEVIEDVHSFCCSFVKSENNDNEMSVDEISAFDEIGLAKLQNKKNNADNLKIDYDSVRLYFRLLKDKLPLTSFISKI